MHERIMAVLLLAAGLAAGDGLAQTTVPVVRVTVVGRTTPAINYRPRSGATTIDFAGTPLQPQARGRATVRTKDGALDIDARFEKLLPASQFGPEYLTYVVWAVTPEGRAANLGELQIDLDTDDGALKVTTRLQAFGLIVTAEPYFAVTQPSDVVVLENAVRDEAAGNLEVVQAKYEVLKRGSYLMKQGAGRLTLKPLEPGTPFDLAEARNAVQLARFAGADRYVVETFDKAAELLADAERARVARRGADAIMTLSRQAAQTAEDARLTALQRQEEEYAAQQQALAAQRESAALERAQAERDKTELRNRLREQLNLILETRETAQGLIVNLSDVLFDTGGASLTPGAREKLAQIAGILRAHPGLELDVDDHADRAGTGDQTQQLSERRAQSVHDYLIRQNVAPAAVGTAGSGNSRPVASNGTSAGRQQNRRVELVISGELIGRRR